MKSRSLRFLPLFLLCAALPCGCVTSRRVGGDSASEALDYGITVQVAPDGTLRLHGQPVAEEDLGACLSEEIFVEGRNGGVAQRAVILEAEPGVPVERLEQVRRDLVIRHRIPRVTLRTERAFKVELEEDPSPRADGGGAAPARQRNGGEPGGRRSGDRR